MATAIDALFELSRQAEANGCPADSIKCMLAVLSTDPLPEGRLRAGMEITRLYMAYTSNFSQAKSTLHNMLLSIKAHTSQSERAQDRCECYSRLADIELQLKSPGAALEVCQQGMEAIKAGLIRGPDAQGWWLHFGCKAAALGATGAHGWEQHLAVALAHVQDALPRIALLLAELHAHVLLGTAQYLVSKLLALEAAHASLQGDNASKSYASELLLHLRVLRVHITLSFAACDEDHQQLKNGRDTLPTLLKAMRSQLRDLEGAVLRHKWLGIGALTGLVMGMQAAMQMSDIGCGSYDQDAKAAAGPEGKVERSSTPLYYIARGLRAVHAELKGGNDPSADRMQWPDACAAHAPSPARLIKATLLVLCAMYHATGIGGDDASITFTSFQGSLRDLQACLQTCSEAGLRTTGLVAMTHHLTGTYAHMMNDWAAAHRHYSLALEKCPGSATFGPVLRTLVATQQALLHLDSGSDDGPSAAAAMLQANANTLTREAEAAHESTGRPPLPPPCSNKWVAALTHLATANTHLAKAARGDDAPAHETVANQSIRSALAMAYEVVFTDQLTILTLATFAPLLLKSMDESGATDMSKTALVLAKKCMDCDSRLLAMASCTGLGFWDDKKAQHRQKKLKAWSQDALAGSRNPAHQELLAWQ